MTHGPNCRCSCHQAKFEVNGPPVIRIFCHCSICQAFNQAPYADVTVFRSKDVAMPGPEHVSYKAYRAPPAVQRGKCVACDKPAVEYMALVSSPKLIFVPTANILDPAFVPEPEMHIFYDGRAIEVDDELPKFSGYWRSQFAFWGKVVPTLLRGPGASL